MNTVIPDYQVPSRNTIRSRIDNLHDEQKNNLNRELKKTNTWTSTSNNIYLTVTERHITENWGKKNNVLCTHEMPEKHTGLNIAEKLQSIASEFDIIT